IYWAFDPETGAMKWQTMVGPAGTSGGIEWGTATDAIRIYVANSNSSATKHTLPSGQTITWGWWSAVDPSTGSILWETADPTSGSFDTGSVSAANGVMYAGSPSGFVYALNAATG